MPVDDHQQKDLEGLINEFLQYRLTRRDFLKRAGALGLASGPAVSLLQSLSRSVNAPAMPAGDPNEWFLPFSSKRYKVPIVVPSDKGRPWGDGTKMAAREGQGNPWDVGCRVTPLIGGFETMSAIREDLKAAISYASTQNTPFGERGYVYMANWRFNSLRDLSVVNPWTTGSWGSIIPTPSARKDGDETAIGLVLRLLNAGIKVRILVWLPVDISQYKFTASLDAHIADHFYLADLVRAESEGLGYPDLGIVGLDIRVAKPLSASHHQKMVVIRVGNTQVAYCGGVDLAFTRRDAPDPRDSDPYQYDPDRFNDLSKPAPQFFRGDWESGFGIPDQNDTADHWPREPDNPPNLYKFVANVNTFKSKQESDLPTEVYGLGDRRDPDTWQTWHDQHLRLEGPIVKTIDEQFGERWVDVSRVFALDDPDPKKAKQARKNFNDNQVIFSTIRALDSNGQIQPLDAPADVAKIQDASSMVQMWRTIPLRGRAATELFTRGEFTIMAGIANACQASTQLIWIFDQYFFSQPLGRLLNALVNEKKHAPLYKPNLYILVILPPFSDAFHLAQHHARKLALNALTDGLSYTQQGDVRLYDRVGVYNLWRTGNSDEYPGGIYCHTKVQMYDRTLLVCGSANLNRRSFTNDTELDCAVLDPDLVDKHQQWLWKVLFTHDPWPSQLNFSGDNWGKAFFTEFQKAALKGQGNFLVPDPWWQIKVDISSFMGSAIINTTPPQTPNGIAREQDYPEDYLDEASRKLGRQLSIDDLELRGQTEGKSNIKEVLLDPTSIRTKVEENICIDDVSGKDPKAPGRLDEIVYLLEACYHKNKNGQLDWPWRKPVLDFNLEGFLP